jgi:glycolate oxidase
MTLAENLRQQLGVDETVVRDDPPTLAAHSGDKWFATEEPEAVVFARSTADVSKLLQFASANRVPVTARGAGYGYVGGCVPARRGVALSLMKMNRIKEIHFADAVAVVEPGVITADLKAAARAKKLFYPPDPASLNECSIGGNVATNAGGPRCLKYGVTRNYVVGLEVVLANGEVLRTGGRVHKNKTGFNLIGLFVGSEGMLGVVTEITLRLLPLPPARATLSAAFETMSEAAAAVQEIFAAGFLPSALEIADSFTLEAARHELGSAFVPAGNAHLLVDLDGQEKSVASEADDIVVPRSHIVDLVNFASALQQKHGFPIACFGHAGDGNVHVNIMAAAYEDPAVHARVDRALDELFAQVLAWGGVITGEHGIGLAKKRWWPEATSEVTRRLHQQLKDVLDPNRILNPGKFLD